MKLLKYLSVVATAALLAVVPVGCGGCGGPAPTPVPVPTPVPPTPPAPDPEQPAGLVVVENTLEANQTRGLFLSDTRVAAFLKSTQLRHAVFTPNTVGPDGQVPPEVKRYLDLTAGKKLPYLFVVGERGTILTQKEGVELVPDKFLALFDTHGNKPRALGLIPAAPKLAWKEFGSDQAPGTKVIPEAEWKPTTLEAFLPPVHDQDGRGQCASSASCGALETQREIAGQSYVYLSAGDQYSGVNGGRDRGSLLEDNLERLTGEGVAPVAMVPYVWDGRRHESETVKAERRKYRITEAYICPTFAHVASALQQGFPVVHGLMWHDNFRVDADGWLPESAWGQGGGHAMLGYGLAQRNGKWGIATRNSWGAAWGAGGNCVIPRNHFNGQIGGYFAIRSAVRTPEPFPPAEPNRLHRQRVTTGELLGLKF